MSIIKDTRTMLGNAISKYLKRIGKTPEQLDDHETETFRKWREVLQGDVTLQTVSTFIQHEIERLRAEREKPGAIDPTLDADYKARLQNYKALLAVIDKPDREREQLAKHLETLLKSPTLVTAKKDN